MKMLRAFYMALKIMSLARFANIIKIYQCMKLLNIFTPFVFNTTLIVLAVGSFLQTICSSSANSITFYVQTALHFHVLQCAKKIRKKCNLGDIIILLLVLYCQGPRNDFFLRGAIIKRKIYQNKSPILRGPVPPGPPGSAAPIYYTIAPLKLIQQFLIVLFSHFWSIQYF